MSATPKRSNRNILLGLMIASGFMLVVTALPVGVMMTWQGFHDAHLGWHWAIIGGIVMTIAIGGLGSLFICVGHFIVKRHRRKQERMIQR
jgi:amino acid transporter